ncbi:MAG: RagB/SusD family nutrient uptake outer membrane protein, partial [Bacteroidales bacterium]|nr:RagB/SusD family nutrient uptake outer membrane protein [Bacteroidales bacterium]
MTALVLSLVACNLGNQEPPFQPQDYTVNGKVEKGPFVSGSTITLQMLDNKMQSLGEMYNTTILDNDGSFSFGTKKFTSPYADLSANGYFFNEVRGELSTGTLNLRAIVDVSDVATVNVNILTHIKYQRVLNLVAAGKSFKEANKQAQQELFGAFGLSEYANIDASRLSIISGDEKAGVLIAISSLLLVERTEAELTEYLAKLCREFAAEGKFSSATQETISADLDELSYKLEDIARHIVERYADLGMEVTVPELKHYFDWDGDGNAGEEGYDNNTDVPVVGPSDNNLIANLYADETNANGVPLLGSDAAMLAASMAMDLAKSANLFNIAQQFYHYNIEAGNNLVSQNIMPTAASISDCWASFYSSMRKAMMLQYADAQQRNVYQGYCSIFTAMQYYYMTTMWGDVPYYPDYESFNSMNPYMERTDYRMILSEEVAHLHYAIDMNNDEKKNDWCNDFFFASNDVARVLLAEIMLSLGNYNEARTMLDCVIQSGFYTLTDANFSDPATIDNLAHCDEVIFALYNVTGTRVSIQSVPYIPVQTFTEVMILYAEACYLLGDWARAHEALDQLAVAKGITINADDLLQTITDARKQLLLYSIGNFAYMKRHALFMQEYGVDEHYQLFP